MAPPSSFPGFKVPWNQLERPMCWLFSPTRRLDSVGFSTSVSHCRLVTVTRSHFGPSPGWKAISRYCFSEFYYYQLSSWWREQSTWWRDFSLVPPPAHTAEVPNLSSASRPSISLGRETARSDRRMWGCGRVGGGKGHLPGIGYQDSGSFF